MATGKDAPLTDLGRHFLVPTNSTHRHYEALRAYFVDGLASTEAAERFGYTPGSFRVLCHSFRRNPDRQFFLPPRKGPRGTSRKSRLREQVIALRKRNQSIYDISEALTRDGESLSPPAVSEILREEGFAPLPRRMDDERIPKSGPIAASVADLRKLDLSPRRFHTKLGGLFLFAPYLAALPFSRIVEKVDLPGTEMVPAEHAMRSLLALKLSGNARHSHAMSHVFDEGIALFAGLNVIPKRSFLTEYSCRVDPRVYPELMRLWFDEVTKLGLERGDSLDVDFHTIPFHGEDALLQKHYVSKRSRRQKGVLAFLVRDDDRNVLCYANAEVRKEDQADEILRFADYWKERTGKLPQELIFDSGLTIYANLCKLNKMDIDFITLRRRSQGMLEEAVERSPSAWRQIELTGVSRRYKRPRIIDTKISLRQYEGKIRQLVIADLGQDDPVFLLTNQLRRSATAIVDRYAKRMIIENLIADSIDFFHMDALSSAVPMKVNCDLQLTIMGSSLYRLLGAKVGNGYAQARSRTIFRDLLDAVAEITITAEEIHVQYQKRAHNPLLLNAGFAEMNPEIPWLGRKRLRLHFG